MVGKPLAETPIGKSRSTRIFEVIRDGHRIDDTPLDELMCKPGDMLVLTAPSRGIAQIREMNGLDFGSEAPSEKPVNPSSLRLVEAIVGPQSEFIGRTIREIGFRRRYGVRAAAMHRRGVQLHDNFLDVPVRFGDTVIFEGPEHNLAKMQDDDDFLSLSETRERPFRREKAPLAIGIAHSIGLDARPFVVAVMFGASASFMTPIGYQTNTYVFGAGGYRFSDFPKVGVPLSILLWIAAIIFIPILWPFTPR